MGVAQVGHSYSRRVEGERQDSGLEYSVYRCFERVQHLKDEWNDLAARVGDLLCSFEWCELWWKHFRRWRQLEIHTLRDEGRLVGVLPLFRETTCPGGVWLRTVRVLGCDYTIHTVGLPIEPAYARRFMGRVLKSLDAGGPWDLLQMGPVRPYNSVVETLAEACADDRRVQTTILDRRDNWCALMDLPTSYEDYLRTLAPDRRRNILRRGRRLGRVGKVTVSRARTPEQIRAGDGCPGSAASGDVGREGADGQFRGLCGGRAVSPGTGGPSGADR